MDRDPPEMDAIFAGYEPNSVAVDEIDGEDLSWLDENGRPTSPINNRSTAAAAPTTQDNAEAAGAAADMNAAPREPRAK